MEMTSVHISSGLVLHQMTSDHNRSELGIHDHSNEPSSSKLVPKVVPLAVKTATSRQELELLFHHHIAMLRTTDESIDSAFARFNTIVTSLKALDEGYSNKNYVRKFLRALHPKWRARFTAIEESKDLTSLSL
ncbi:hypothetical protein Tco_0965889 [Tanacetum coccineum]